MAERSTGNRCRASIRSAQNQANNLWLTGLLARAGEPTEESSSGHQCQ